MTVKQTSGVVTMGLGNAPPPVNNACMPDIYNKLDADTIEKTRVLNALLDVRLKVQEKVLAKYKSAAEKSFSKERDRVKTELRNISRRLPNYADIPHLETKIKKLRKRRRSQYGAKHNCVFTTEPKEIPGISAEKDDKPFCDRFFSHHIPTKTKFYKDVLPNVNKGMSMPELRPRPPGTFRRVFPLGTNVIQDDRQLGTNVLQDDGHLHSMYPTIHALDDNFVASKGYIRDDDDSKTV